MYKYDGGNWTRIGQDIIGLMVSLSGNGTTIVVGDQRKGVGEVRLLRYDGSSNKWDQIGETISGLYTGERFGASVSLDSDGTVFAVGAPLYGSIGYFDNEFAGAVRVFHLNES